MRRIRQRELRRCSNDSYGVLLKASDHQLLEGTIAELAEADVLVVTLVRHLLVQQAYLLCGTNYVGAGRTGSMASFPMAFERIKNSRDSDQQYGFSWRKKSAWTGFIQALDQRAPHPKTITVSEGYGIDSLTSTQMCKALEQDSRIKSRFTAWAGETARFYGLSYIYGQRDPFIGYDLDEENRAVSDC